jgi:hypothetical protein
MPDNVVTLQLRPWTYSGIDRALNKNISSGQESAPQCINGGSGSNGG